MLLLYIALGGAAGAVARYGLGGWVHDRAGPHFPWGTFVINVLGSLLIGFAVRYLEAVRFTPEARALVTIGLLGSFTTFSTFSYETVALLEDGEWARAALYAVGSLLLGLAAVYAGLVAATLVLHARG
ncbi:MAG: fluoride efflux transporter CrcB [Longimicrobiales bacterium]